MIRKCNRETVTDTKGGETYDIIKETAAFKVGNLTMSITTTLKDPNAKTQKVFDELALKAARFIADNEDPDQLNIFKENYQDPNQVSLSVGKGRK